jgi:hypothetical protein
MRGLSKDGIIRKPSDEKQGENKKGLIKSLISYYLSRASGSSPKAANPSLAMIVSLDITNYLSFTWCALTSRLPLYCIPYSSA